MVAERSSRPARCIRLKLQQMGKSKASRRKNRDGLGLGLSAWRADTWDNGSTAEGGGRGRGRTEGRTEESYGSVRAFGAGKCGTLPKP